MSFDVFGARRDAQSWALKHTEASSGLLSRALTLRWAPRFCNPAMLLATALAFRDKGVRWGEIRNLPLFPAHYTGHEQSDDIGLVYMQQRYYDPIIGRFYSNDPVGFTASNPMMFNRYAYANNNPYKYVDPDGEFPMNITPSDTARYQSMGQMQQAQRQIQQAQSYANNKVAPKDPAGVALGGVGVLGSIFISPSGPAAGATLFLSLDGIRSSWVGGRTLSGMGMEAIGDEFNLEDGAIKRLGNLGDFSQNSLGGGIKSLHKVSNNVGDIGDAAGATSQIRDMFKMAGGVPVVEVESIRLNETEKKRE